MSNIMEKARRNALCLSLVCDASLNVFMMYFFSKGGQSY